MNFSGIIRRLHLWSGVVLGVQVVLWMLSGVVMSIYHIDLVRGDRQASPPAVVELGVADYAPPSEIIAKANEATAIELRMFLERPVYEVRSPAGASIYDALTGERLSPVEEGDVRIVARGGFIGKGELERVHLVDNPGSEMRNIGPRPLWRAEFSDRLNTRIYISPETGEILRRRNDVWRLFDFFWMLHIMDYETRDDINNPLLRIAAIAGLIFAASGMVMLFIRRGRAAIANDVKAIRSLLPK